MSRAEELRAKFRAKGAAIKAEMESPYGQFRSKLSMSLDDYCATLEDQLAQQLFDRYSHDQPKDFDKWISDTVIPLFKSQNALPVWRFEPDWLCENGHPLTFIGQFEGQDETFYAFQGFRDTRDGKIRYTKLAAQGDSYRNNMEGEIVG
ncbi:hypothetical protein [Neorhizobium sp. JUb45]|uniref:hypothetical protein n=1 Tax=unclassified Neorhizobium TaxID=2629175 RepID=UPI001047405B|nr:hypothetical protein [Neorhizobium sp. JUb45]TCQ95074.1 hypothetical protein EDF70_1253 [Neorhizobium sp. JUb45]